MGFKQGCGIAIDTARSHEVQTGEFIARDNIAERGCAADKIDASLAFGLRNSLVATPWQPIMIAVYSTYTGMLVESLIIDSDHRRHVFLLLGVLWGLIAAARTSLMSRRLEQASSRRLAPGLARPTSAS